MFANRNLRAPSAAYILSLLFLALMAVSNASGQSTQGGVRGTITDAQGAAVPDVKISLANDSTAEIRSTITNNDGIYNFADVVPGTYTVIAEAPNFKKLERKGITLATQQFVTVDAALEVGTVTESVLVTEQAPVIESSNASQGQVLDNQQLTELPNLGRNPFMMSRLAQNVIQVGPPAYNRMEDQSGSSMISIAGGPVRGNNYLLDGIPITDANNRAIIIPSLEAVQEVKVQANTYSADMARTGGGMFNTLMRSGTNDYHGSLYGHLRRTDWDANNFFSNAAGLPITEQPNTTWGASFGGKIWIPKLYNGANKTFFYLAVEHYDDQQSDSSDFAVPTLLERQGDFSQSGITVVDPTTGKAFANNTIPANRLSPVGLAIASQYPQPASAPSSFGGTDLTVASNIKARAVQYTGKIDEDFTKWWHSSLSYLRYYSLEPGDTWFNSEATTAGWRLLRRVDATQFNNIFTIDPTTVLTVRYGFNRFPNLDYNSSQGFDVASLGMSPAFAKLVGGAQAEFPAINMTTFTGLGDTADYNYYSEASRNMSASVNKYFGRHTINAGFDYRRLATSGSGLNCPTGCYTFYTDKTLSTSNTGYDLADLLLGAPYTRSADTASTLTDYIHYYGGYVQDDFRASSKLTLNLGIRWEHEGGVEEKNNGLITGFDTTAVNPLAASVPDLALKGAVEYAGVNGNKTTAGNYNENKWGPRVGFAYSVDSKTVLRGGYGIFWAPQIALGGPFATLGYANTTQYTGKGTADIMTDPFPAGIQAPVGNSQGTSAGIGTQFNLISPSARSPMVQQYSFDIQRQVPGDIALEIAYVGSHSNHLTLGNPLINVNALPTGDFALGTDYLNATIANPFANAISSGTLSGPTISRYQTLLPYAAYTYIYENFGSQNHAAYNSFVLKAQKRFSHGLTFLSTLTVSRNMDESSGGAGTSVNPGAQNYPQNPYNMAAEYSLSNVDTPINWATAITYELPIGKGKAWGGNMNRLADLVVGGWSVNAVGSYRTGFPLQIYQSDLNNGYGYGAQRPNATGFSPTTAGSVEDRLYNYIDPAAFSGAAQGTLGNLSRSVSLRGPGSKNWDLSVFKDFVHTERVKAQFRGEALNAFNSPLFQSPDVNFSDSKFGQITTQANFSRQLQLAVRLSF